MKALIDHPAFNVAIFALLLSLPWEFGQMWLYAGASEISHLQGLRICMAATAGDAVIMMVAFGTVAAFARSSDWVRTPRPSQTTRFVMIGLIVTIAVELIATRTSGPLSWRYTAAMPVTPWLHVGIAPLLMWAIVPLLVLWFVRRQIGHLASPT